jgi:hypothetical protein
MELRKRQFIALAASFVILGGNVSGEQGGGIIRREEPPRAENEIQRSAVTFAAPWRPAGASTVTRILGTVIDIRQVPVAHARVQLRNLDTGNIEQEDDANEAGEYGFELTEPGTFVVEMVMVDGYVLALSNAGAIGRYETMNTVVQLPGRWDSRTNPRRRDKHRHQPRPHPQHPRRHARSCPRLISSIGSRCCTSTAGPASPCS